MSDKLDLREYAKFFERFVKHHELRDHPSIVEMSTAFEEWFARQLQLRTLKIVHPDLALKHKNMSVSPFLFLRASFYAWISRLMQFCPEVLDAPVVLSIGDSHLENFGTWRDLIEAWLNWGCNDVDEAFPLPYTNDLIRLAVSTKLAIRENHLSLKPREAYDAILEGYREGIELGGQAIILGEEHPVLREMCKNKLKSYDTFFPKLRSQMSDTAVPVDALALLETMLGELYQTMPKKLKKGKKKKKTAKTSKQKRVCVEFGHRIAGQGSLGDPRIVAMSSYHGNHFAREAKAYRPSACYWAGITSPKEGEERDFYNEILERAIRVKDPFVKHEGNWIVRRLSPDNSRVELSDLPAIRDEHLLLRYMGREIANVHLGTPGARAKILKDLKKRGAKWLRKAAKKMAGITIADQKVWAEHYKKTHPTSVN